MAHDGHGFGTGAKRTVEWRIIQRTKTAPRRRALNF